MPGPSQEANQQFRAQIDAALAQPPSFATGGPQTMDFCTLWPTAKPILQAVGGIIGFIPGVGAGAGPVLNALVSVGDQIYNSTCGKQ
jgi:hypothetical protein